MIVTLLSWGIILWMSSVLGNIFIRKIMPETFRNTTKWDVYCVTGLMILNVYAQIYSIFSGVGRLAFGIAFIAAAILSVGCIAVGIKAGAIHGITKPATWKVCVSIVLAGVILVLTMKAPEFVDTYLYHVQAIRWIEEYGVVPGLGNLHCRFAYNSAFLALQALFSFSWIMEPLHSLNGFLSCFFVVYAVMTNHIFTKEKNQLSDYLKLLYIPYVFLNQRTLSSPGTDMLAMFLVIYIASKWSECMERKEESVQSYGFLCILAVWALTVKLSTAGSLLLVILPAIQLIRKRNRGYIIKDLVCGLVTAIPWLIRNVLISGYLIYPYAAIDWFPVDWKMPEEVLEMDKMEIVVFGREVKNVAAYHDPVTAWLPTWFGNQMMKYKLLIIVGFAATAFLIAALIIMICKAIRKRKLTEGIGSAQLLMLLISILLGEVFWLVSAPLVRYGMVYLMMPVAAAYYLVEQKLGSRMNHMVLIAGTCVLTLWGIYKNENFTWVVPQGYWEMDSIAENIDGVTIYRPAGDQWLNGYYPFPAAKSEEDLQKVELRGEDLSSGFRTKKTEE